jgi:hypothetical protein
MATQSLRCEAELLAHRFHASLHNVATAGEFLPKLGEARLIAQRFQHRKLAGASGALANAFGVGSEANLQSPPPASRSGSIRLRAWRGGLVTPDYRAGSSKMARIAAGSCCRLAAVMMINRLPSMQ